MEREAFDPGGPVLGVVAPSGPAPPAPPRGRVVVLNNADAWRTEASGRKAEARRRRRCVECAGALPSGRSPYCSSRCRWRFHGHYFWDAARVVVLRRDRYTCRICRRRFRARELEVDHVIELAAGGRPLEFANLQTVCRPCHRAKTVQFVRWRAGRARPRPPAIGAAGAPEPESWVSPWFPA